MAVFANDFSRVKFVMRVMAAALAITVLGFVAQPHANAQIFSRKKHETTATRQRKMAAAIVDEYTHRYEIFVGGGYMTFRPGQLIPNSGIPPQGDQKANGEGVWAVHPAYFFSPKWAVTGAIQGQYGEADTGNNSYGVLRPNISQYSFMAGPEYRFYRHEKTAISVSAVAGVTYGIFDGDDKAVPPADLGMWTDGFRPGGAVSINLEHNLFNNLAFRLQPRGVINTFGSKEQYSYGFNAGLVYRFGRQGTTSSFHLPSWKK
jgi:hypothetical protein